MELCVSFSNIILLELQRLLKLMVSDDIGTFICTSATVTV
jgi:hypothetical protein